MNATKDVGLFGSAVPHGSTDGMASEMDHLESGQLQLWSFASAVGQPCDVLAADQMQDHVQDTMVLDSDDNNDIPAAQPNQEDALPMVQAEACNTVADADTVPQATETLEGEIAKVKQAAEDAVVAANGDGDAVMRLLVHKAKELQQRGPTEQEQRAQAAVEQGEKPNLDKDTLEKLKFFAQCKEENYVVPTGGSHPAKGLWERTLKRKASLKKQYDKVKGRADRARFRSDWLQGEENNFRAEKMQEESLENSEGKDWHMLPVGRVAWLEGGGKQGWINCYTLVQKCFALGPKYWEIDEGTDGLRIYYSVKSGSTKLNKNGPS